MFLYIPEFQQTTDPYSEPDETALDKIAFSRLPSYQEIEAAKEIFDTLGIRLEWLQWILGKRLSEFDLYDWQVFVGMGINVRDGIIDANEVRQYVIDMINWAKLRDMVDSVWFEAEEWPIDCLDFIDIPALSSTNAGLPSN